MAETKTLKVSDLLADKAGVSRTHTLLDATGAEHSFTFAPNQAQDIPQELA